ncbi:MAG: ABC transporter substrate-binding protein [Euryarchaeota archaeon]|nr:ABC transporter substrate-binding protein [Euryarchaeota archaeon]
MRVVSFLPSATEIVYALGKGDQLVGRSHECDHPPEATGLPVVMRAREPMGHLSSREIHEKVGARLESHEELYEIDEGLLARLSPDVILTQELCRVCSITPKGLADALEKLERKPRVVVLAPTRLAHVMKDVETVARELGVPDRGTAMVAELERKLASAAGHERARPTSGEEGTRPRVAVLEWLDPPIVAGLWVPDMIRKAGGLPVLAKAGAPGGRTTWDSLRGAGADLLVAAPCAYPLERTLGELRGPRPHPLEDLHPPRGVWAADEAFFSRPGPRLVEGVELLSDLVHGQGRPRRSFEGRAVPAFKAPLPPYRIPTRR